jgi:hypothetical protein
MANLKKCLVLFSLILLLPQLQAQTTTPKPGSPERKALMDALRSPVEAELKRNVVFKVNALKVQGDWAFMRGVPQLPNGAPMDYRASHYQAQINDGPFEDWICALWKRQGSRWRVVRYHIGATDVVYSGWDREFGAPSAIFR